MKFLSLQSGSSGNCTYVESGSVRLLFDAGISGNQAAQRLAAHGVDISQVEALLISHDHQDHTRCLGIYQRKFKLPLWTTRQTLNRVLTCQPVGPLDRSAYFVAGSELQFGHVRVQTVPTPHDGVDGVAFIVDDGQVRLGIFTDLGHVFKELTPLLASLDAVLLESNFDSKMLEQSRYPESVRRRIRGPRGHISNTDAAELLGAAVSPRLQWACLGHLSDECNEPKLALRTCRRSVPASLPLYVAPRYDVSPWLEIVPPVKTATGTGTSVGEASRVAPPRQRQLFDAGLRI